MQKLPKQGSITPSWSHRYKNWNGNISPMTVNLFHFTYICFIPLSPTWLLPDLTIWATRRVSNKKQEQLTLPEHLDLPPILLVGCVLLIFLDFCAVFFTFWLPATYVLWAQCCTCLWIVHSWLLLSDFSNVYLHRPF